MKNIDKDILQIAVPSIVSNVTVPLLGIVDTAITGHLGSASFLAAIAMGSSIFSLCYWLFSFLRMGTGGLTAQAFGKRDGAECTECLRKSMTISIIAGVGIIALQGVIADIALGLMESTADAEGYARTYFKILVWGAPANLGLSALNGWLIGMQNAKIPMAVAIGQNVLNIAVSCMLVLGLGWKVEGVAAGTLVAQWTGFLVALICVKQIVEKCRNNASWNRNEDEGIGWGRFFRVNRDIFLRTLCLIAVMFSFTAFGARQSEIVLAVNALLMQMFLLVSYVMDGFAYAGEAIGGRMVGANDRKGLLRLTRHLFIWGGALALGFAILFSLGGDYIVWILTNDMGVRQTASSYLWVPVVIPLVSVAAFVFDGIFIGCTMVRGMLVSIAIATAAYFCIALTMPGNHWLWIAFLTYMSLRGGVQACIWANHRR